MCRKGLQAAQGLLRVGVGLVWDGKHKFMVGLS